MAALMAALKSSSRVSQLTHCHTSLVSCPFRGVRLGYCVQCVSRESYCENEVSTASRRREFLLFQVQTNKELRIGGRELRSCLNGEGALLGRLASCQAGQALSRRVPLTGGRWP